MPRQTEVFVFMQLKIWGGGKECYSGESWETETAVELLLKINIFTSTNFLVVGDKILMFTFAKQPLCCQLHHGLRAHSKYYILLFT